MADKERLDIISSAIAGLLKRQQEAEERLARIERALAIPPSERPQLPCEAVSLPEESAVPRVEALQPSLEPEAPPTPTPIGRNDPPPPPGERLETEMGLRWVNRVGAFTLVLAVAFFFKLAIDNQWIGPAARVILGILAGFGTLAVADMLWRRGHIVYSQGVSGMGIAILLVSFYASFAFYQLVPHTLAFVLMVSCTAMGCALALRYDASAIAALGLLGGFATPVLLTTGVDRPWIFFSYVLLLDVAALTLDRLRAWRRLSVLALAATIFLFLSWGEAHFISEKRLVATIYNLAYYTLFVTVPSVWFLIIAQAFATVALSLILTRDIAPFSFLLLAISAVGLAISDRRNSAAGVQVTVAASWLAYAIFYADFMDPVPIGALLAPATALFLLFFLWIPWRVLYRDLPVRASDLSVVAGNAAAFFVAGYLLLETNYEGYLGLFAVAVAVPHFGLGISLWRSGHTDPGHVRNAVVVYLAVALTLLTLAAPIQFTGLRITMAWMLEAAALVWIGRRANAPRFIHAAFAVFALGYSRLFAVDAWIYSASDLYTLVWNGRFVTFLVSAACLWLAARWTPGRIAALPYLAGHVALFWILSQEGVAWARRVSAAESAWNAQSAALSILWALYAVVLVASGVLWRFALNRRMGLVLLAAVVAKLYLNDIWQLRMAYRVTAFAALGVLLLLTSFLYSRYRDSIGNWWRDERPQM